MTITLDVTVAGASANSFGTLAEANAYLAARLGSAAWFDQGDIEVQKAALVTAARRLNAEIYRGNRLTATQALPFPRSGLYLGGVVVDTATIPALVKEAQFEEALSLLVAAGADGIVDPMAPTGLEPFKALGVGDIKLDLRDPAPDDASRTLLSIAAYRLLRGWLLTNFVNIAVGARNVRLLRS